MGGSVPIESWPFVVHPPRYLPLNHASTSVGARAQQPVGKALASTSQALMHEHRCSWVLMAHEHLATPGPQAMSTAGGIRLRIWRDGDTVGDTDGANAAVWCCAERRMGPKREREKNRRLCRIFTLFSSPFTYNLRMLVTLLRQHRCKDCAALSGPGHEMTVSNPA